MKINKAVFVKGIRGTDDILNYPQVAFVGRSNVGKSSLLNNILGQKDLVKIGKTPGKTQEINFFRVNETTYFVDVPGYGFAKMPQDERASLEKLIVWYLSLPLENRTIVLVLDALVGPTEQDIEVFDTLYKDGVKVIVVANKIDKLNQKEKHLAIKNINQTFPNIPIIEFSSKEHIGKSELLAKL